MTPPYPIHTVDLREVVDVIDPPFWAIRLCDLYLEDGTVLIDCSVQSDGHTAAWETLEDENGNPLDLQNLPPLYVAKP